MIPRTTWLRMAKGAVAAFLLGAALGWIAHGPKFTERAVTAPLALPRMVNPSEMKRPRVANQILLGDGIGAPPKASEVIPPPYWILVHVRPRTRDL